jgi:hypothetical protein
MKLSLSDIPFLPLESSTSSMSYIVQINAICLNSATTAI